MPREAEEPELTNLLTPSHGEPVRTGAEGKDPTSGSGAGLPVAVHNCSRIGRVANPPGFSLAEWFRSGRRS